MAPSTRTRPFSASSASTARTNGSITSYFTDRSGVLGLDGGSKSDRPLPELLNLLVDAAHQSHDSRNAIHPPTHAYTLFKQRVTSTAYASGGTLSPPPPPCSSSLDASRSVGSLATHSSTAVYAWGDPTSRSARSTSAASATASAGGGGGAGTGAGGEGSQSAAAAAAGRGPSRGPSPLGLRASASLPAQHFFSPSAAKPAAEAVAPAARRGATANTAAAGGELTVGRAVNAVATAPAASTVASTSRAGAVAGKPTSRSGSGSASTSKKASTSKGHDFGYLRMAAAQGHWGVKAFFEGRTPEGLRDGSSGSPGGVSAVASSGRLGAAAAMTTATATARVEYTRTSTAGSSFTGHGPGGVAIAAAVAGHADNDGQLAVRRVKSASSAAATATDGGYGGCSSSGVGSYSGELASGCSADYTEGAAGLPPRVPRQIRRSEVVSKALSVWEGAELEVICLYDSNFQTANRQGQQGVPLRVPAPAHIGPLSYLYRWYCKRATQFRSPVTSADLPDAPAMPPAEDPWKTIPATAAARGAAVGAGAGGADRRSGSVTRNGNRPASAGSASVSVSGGAGGGAAGAMWLRKATTMRDHGGPGIVAYDGTIVRVSPNSTAGGASAAAAAAAGAGAAGGGRPARAERETTSSGRRLNTSLDPVISLSEVIEMLEDLEVVPQLASRLDITKIFNAAATAAAAAAAGADATATVSAAAAGSLTSASSYSFRAAAVHSRPPPPPPQQQQQRLIADAAGSQTGRQAMSPARRRPASAAAAAAAGGGNNCKADPRVATLTAIYGGGSTSKNIATSTATQKPQGGKARPSSAPRMTGKPAGGGVGGGAAGGDGSAAAALYDNVIPRVQPHAEEVRFPVFKDILVRLAVAISCAEAAPLVGGPVAASAAANSASAAGASQYGFCRTMSADGAEAAVRRLLERLQLYRKDLRGLKHRLDLLARLAKEHGARVHANRMRYFAVPSPVEAAQEVTLPPGASPPPPGARPGLPGRPLSPWGVLVATPAPSYLTAILTEEDQGDEEDYRAAWREFGAVALDLGVLQPGELRKCRLMLHSRGPHTLSVQIDATDAPFCDISHMGLHAVPPGMPLRVDVTIRLYDLGEVVGELRLRYNSSQDRQEREVVVPVYGMVCPMTGAAAEARTRPRSASERSVLAAKATREPVSRPVAAAALAAAPLGHCGPPRRGQSPPPPLSSTSSSSYLAGYGSSSFMADAALTSHFSVSTAAPLASASVAAVAGAVADTAVAGGQKLQSSVRWADAEDEVYYPAAVEEADAGPDAGVSGGGGGGEATGNPTGAQGLYENAAAGECSGGAYGKAGAAAGTVAARVVEAKDAAAAVAAWQAGALEEAAEAEPGAEAEDLDREAAAAEAAAAEAAAELDEAFNDLEEAAGAAKASFFITSEQRGAE